MRQLLLVISFAILFINNHAISQDTLIHQGSEWKYYEKGGTPEDYWMINNYPDEDWNQGMSPLGYGEGTEKTILNFGVNPDSKILTHYFRKTISIDDPNKYFVYVIKILRDDGAVVYINGREIFRSNMPDVPITDTTRALTTVSDEEETIFYEYILSPNYFTKGDNHISVSIHQSRPQTSDCSFNFELSRNNDLFSINRILTDNQNVGQQTNNNFSLLSIQMELENKNNEINHIKLENRNLRNYGVLIIVLFFGLILTLFFIIIRNINSNNAYVNKVRQTEEELNQKNKEIINYALNSVQLKRFIKNIKEELGGFSKNIPKDDLLTFDRILTKLSFYGDNEEEWERLKSHFDLIHSGFFSKLKSKCPLLTQTELEHCSFIKLQLPTKEIARMLNIDPKSVQASRYRIKKKMGLPQEADLRDVIEKF